MSAPSPRPRTVLFDHDGGVDDFISLMLLLAMPHIELAGVVVTPADCFLRPAVSATLKILRLFGRPDVPVSQGLLHGVNPFPRVWRREAYAIDALPLLNESQIPLPDPVDAAGHHFLADALQRSSTPLTVLITGPVTNLAATLEEDASLAEQVGEVVWMGGALQTDGNVRDYEHDGSAEWNAYWDPTANAQLWRSGVPITLFPLDATNCVPVTREFLNDLARQRRHPLSDLAGQCWAMTVGTVPSYEYTYHMWDVLTTGYLGAPECVRFRKVRCEAVVDAPSAGRIREVESGGTQVKAAEWADAEAFLAYVLELLRTPL